MKGCQDHHILLLVATINEMYLFSIYTSILCIFLDSRRIYNNALEIINSPEEIK